MKRTFDVLVSLLALVLLSPIWVAVIIILFFTIGRNLMFTQLRGGYRNKLFKLYKFRTMQLHDESMDSVLPDHKRITSFGRFLRKTSLDELPGLINVLKGEMSLVGPRPLLVEYLPLYNKFQRRRHEVKPGITGWAQVNGRNSISWDQKFKLDIWYIDNRTFLLDLKILGMTVIKVLSREGVSAHEEVTMPKFTGNGD